MTNWQNLLISCQIPPNLHTVSFERSSPATFIKGDMGQITAFRSGFITFGGPCGVGKTHFSVCIVREHLLSLIRSESEKPGPDMRYAPVWFTESVEMLEDVKSEFSKKQRTALDFYRDHPFLVIDDLGSEKESDWSKESVYTIINYRYNNDLTTVITTNADTLQDKIVSRMRSGIVIELGGDDRRKS